MVDDELPSKLNSAIRDSETVQWTGSTHKLAKLIEASVGSLLFFGFIGVFLTIFIGGAVGSPLLGAAVGGGLVGLFLLLSVIQFFTGESKHVVTDERVISYSSSVLEGDLEYIEWADVNSIDVEEGIIDNLFGTGTLEVEGHRADDISLKHIADAYETLNTIEKER